MRNYASIIIWILIIVYLSLSPANELPDVELINIPHFDKLVHLGMYFILIVLWLIYTSKFKNWNLSKLRITSLLGVIVIGGLMEVLQEALPVNRDGNIEDMLANLTGGFIAYLSFQNILLKNEQFRKLTGISLSTAD